MGEVKHTPGPWRFVANVGYVMGSDGTGTFGPREVQVGKVGSYSDKELLEFNRGRWDSDGRLIAAAPDLLEALKSLVYAYGMNSAEPNEAFKAITSHIGKASAAIAKAESPHGA